MSRKNVLPVSVSEDHDTIKTAVQDGMLFFFYNYRHSHPLWETSAYILNWKLQKYSLRNMLSPLPRSKEEGARVFRSHFEKPEDLDLHTPGTWKSAESRLCLFVQLLMVQSVNVQVAPVVLGTYPKRGMFPKDFRKEEWSSSEAGFHPDLRKA